jgi:hypothetical protein
VIFLFSSFSYAQFDLGEKLKKRIDKELEKAADDAIDETVDAVKEGGKDKKEDSETEDSKKNKSNDEEVESNTPTETNTRLENKTSTKTFRTETSGQTSFEGKVVFDVEEKGEQQVIEYYSKDNQYLMEMPEKGGSILFDRDKLKMFVLMHKEEMYMETPMMPLSAASGGGSISKTGETKTILGYDCEKFLFKQKDRKGEAWMTDELGAFMFFMDSQKEMPEWQSDIVDAGYFPLQVTEYDNDGNESIFNVREVTPMNLSDDLFIIPSSYKELDLTNMGGFDKLIGQ